MSGPFTARAMAGCRRKQYCLVIGMVISAGLLSWALLAQPALAQAPAGTAPATASAAELSDVRPYDDKLVRLSVVLGAVHYLRELCGGNDGQAWRDRMRDLIDHEKGSALRRVKLTKSFNNGYRSYRRTYQSCTAPAQATLTRFMAEGVELSDQLLRETQ